MFLLLKNRGFNNSLILNLPIFSERSLLYRGFCTAFFTKIGIINIGVTLALQFGNLAVTLW